MVLHQIASFFNMHFKMEESEEESLDNVDVTYKTKNLHSTDGRYIYFIADQPHLLKTARNCLANSGSGKNTRYLWNNGSNLLWSHISQLFFEDQECGLYLLPK